jgi:hypothetical protein
MDPFHSLPHIEALVTGGGDITLGAVAGIECAATACDEAQCLAMLVKRDEETLAQLLQRLDRAIEEAQDNACMIDEINTKR